MQAPETHPQPTPSTQEKASQGPGNLPNEGRSDAGTPAAASHPKAPPPQEIGGREGPEPTRYGDWEVNGICSDF